MELFDLLKFSKILRRLSTFISFIHDSQDHFLLNDFALAVDNLRLMLQIIQSIPTNLTSLAVLASWNLEQIKLSNLPSIFILQKVIIAYCFIYFSESRRRIYDQYGKNGLQMYVGKEPHRNNFGPRFINTFMFRNPQEVFEEFFRPAIFENPPPSK